MRKRLLIFLTICVFCAIALSSCRFAGIPNGEPSVNTETNTDIITDTSTDTSSGEDTSKKYAKVIFNLNGGTAVDGSPLEKNIEINWLLSAPNPPDKDGYRFVGWSVNGRVVSFPYRVTEDTVFYATWVATGSVDTNTDTEISTDTDSETDALNAEIEYDKSNSIRGMVSFDLTLENSEGDVVLRYTDESKEILPYYSNIYKATIDNSETIEIDDLVIPKSCKYINVLTVNDEYFFEIPIQYRIVTSTKYRFGALSDVHYNRGDYFNDALDFLDTQGVDFVGVAGDLTDSGELEYLQKFNDAIKEREYKVYTTSGNHDTPAVLDGSWQENINTGILEDKEVVEIAPNGLDFVYKPEKIGGDVFVFLCQMRWSYPSVIDNTEYTILDKSQLVWLEEVLEENKDNTVFLFFHTFLSDPEGEASDAVGNLQNSAGYEYPLPFSYGTADETEFRLLLKEYKNVVFFSGHSHWMFELEELNDNLNISNFDGEYGYMVHIPSVSEPRYIEDDDPQRTSMTGMASEGWIVEVYMEAIILTPVDFISETYYTEYTKIIPLM